jgi:hypothetical protein
MLVILVGRQVMLAKVMPTLWISIRAKALRDAERTYNKIGSVGNSTLEQMKQMKRIY